MGRTQLDKAVAKLKNKIKTCENNKKKILNYVENIKNKCINKEITYYEYDFLINQKLDGKTIQEWLNHYDFFIEKCEKQLEREIGKFKSLKILPWFFFLIFLLILIPSLFYFKPIISSSIENGFKISKSISGLILKEMQEGVPHEDLSPSQEESLLARVIFNVSRGISEISK